MSNKGRVLVQHYESCLAKFGDSAKGVDWPDENGARTRYRVMAELMKGFERDSPTLLDYGCGLGHFFDYLGSRKNLSKVKYTGIDASPIFVAQCKKKHGTGYFFQGDVLEAPLRLPRKKYDFIVLNGVLTEKRELTQKQMVDIFQNVLSRLFPLCAKGLAFNVMSIMVDWKRNDLFHLDFNLMADFVVKNLSRHFCVRHDYGLYEYTVYVYRTSR